MYTDTRVYRGVIPECTNLGVGYYDHHGKDEYLDYHHARALMMQCRTLDWENLPVKRKPVSSTEYSNNGRRYGYGGYEGYGHQGGFTGFPTAAPPAPQRQGKKARKAAANGPIEKKHNSMLELLYESFHSAEDIELMFQEAPEEAASAVFRAILEGRMAQINLKIALDRIAKE